MEKELFVLLFKKLSELGEEEGSALLSRGIDVQSVMPTVVEIVNDVQERGDRALCDQTERFDGVRVGRFRVGEDEIEKADEEVPEKLKKALEIAVENIAAFHHQQLDRDLWMTQTSPGAMAGQMIVPLDSAGAYVPGGRAAYPSSALMTVVPAKVAGVERVVVCTPPGKDGKVSSITLVAAQMAGADEIYRVGGVQAVAAMAFGTETIRPVQKIVGPGNIYVTAAKLLLRSTVEIDMPAGPSEVLIIADYTAEPEVLASDMIAQAEHDPQSISVLVTDDEDLAIATKVEVEKQAKEVARREIVKKSLAKSAILKAGSTEEAIGFSNSFAPEHLEIIVRDPMTVLRQIRSAGSVFLGPYTPVAAGDYASGTNHVLPTSGYARVFSGLNADAFVKKITVQQISKDGLRLLSDAITVIAEAEGLAAHAESVRKRLVERKPENL
ncbi:histidinol dehydrogenase [Methanotrichaceae archaeon M04Ac]|uniref:Histidinol dehydrogenase n=1 Tax=Candidatus Methanocrinis alkalitolerans TaxID=3033395 RepID=A0ABT5XGN3_9EURY|nr:histidinol dehydrogenase [Candidatus Methanocrinis alkalitolerans]MCR3883888.1 histidinol dehydrogenase [Methanothrix sp.]MDF0593879.1 histidinol dehydrogenase [Candidatus Methanocrinis alkalitolerans]